MDRFGIWLSSFGVIFAIIDPFGYVPVFISMTSSDSDERRRWMLRRACFTAGVILILFTFIGNFILTFFGISIPALQISGGLILLIIGFDMVRVLPLNAKITAAEENEAVKKEDISIVPLAIPMLSGPASIATVVVLGSKSEDAVDYAVIVSSIAITLCITYVILRSADRVRKAVGLTGLHVVTRVMGLLLLAMAVQFILNGWEAIR
jgi:multiple antibiotic resistance protein